MGVRGLALGLVGVVLWAGLSGCQQPSSFANPGPTMSVPEARSYLQALKDDRIGLWSPEGEHREFVDLVEAGVHHGRLVPASRSVKYQFSDRDFRDASRDAVKALIEDPKVAEGDRWTRSPAEGFPDSYTRRRLDGSVETVRLSWVDGAKPVLWVVQTSTPVSFIGSERVDPMP